MDFFYFIVVAQQKTKSTYVKFIEKTFNFFEKPMASLAYL